MKRTIIAVVVAVCIAAAGGVAIYAASGTVDNTNAGPGGARAGGPMLVGGPMGGMEGTEHGEFQLGDITALSDDSITVKSEDGYEQTYAITNDTQKTDDLAKGDRVSVVATTENNKATAKSIMEPGAMGGPGNGRRNGGNGGNDGNGGNGENGQPPGN
jgi:hypothetical protein